VSFSRFYQSSHLTFNSRKSAITAESLQEYKALIKNATSDLEAHLDDINEKLENLLAQTASGSGSDTAELRLVKEERLSTQKCLEICAQLSKHIDQLRPDLQRSGSSTESTDPLQENEQVFSEGLQECKMTLMKTTAKLEMLQKDRLDRMVKKMKTGTVSEEEIADVERLQEEWEAVRQSLNIYSKAESHLRENISIIENEAISGDTIQYMASTDRTIINGKNRAAGWRTRQLGGHYDNTSFKQASQDLTRMHLHDGEVEDEFLQVNIPSAPDAGQDTKSGSEFRKYGRGFKLPPDDPADMPPSRSLSKSSEPKSGSFKKE
jgi:serine phosphatase RsbU (regulator of sigma subunit)